MTVYRDSRQSRASCQYVNALLLNVHSLQGVCLVIMIRSNYIFIAFICFIFSYSLVFVLLCTFVAVSMCVCHVEIKRYLLYT